MAITKKELMEEIGVVLRDEFVADIKAEENGLVLCFIDGQKFRLTIAQL